MKSRAHQILDKSISAILSAIEIYNKPTFLYREDSFAILTTNAWELLLKARILQLDHNKMSSITEYERRCTRKGVLSSKLFRKINRCGNPVTLSLFKAYDLLVNEFGDTLDPKIRKNLEALVEIRDNSVHFMNKDIQLSKKVHEIGTASLKNYLNLVRQWFGTDLSKYNLFLMPIAFLREIPSAEGIILNNEERRLLKFMQDLEKQSNDTGSENFNFSLDVAIKLSRVADASGTKVTISDSPDAIPITLRDEDIRERYPWDYNILITRLKKRYIDIKLTNEFYQFKKQLEQDKRYCKIRLLDPGNSNSPKKKFYNPNIVREFDKHYLKKIRNGNQNKA
jgi:hypothetical protein